MIEGEEPELPRRRLVVGDWAVDVRRAGPAEGQPVVLVHGIGVSGSYFVPFARVLAQDRPVYVLDLPGYGSTPNPPAPLGIRQLANAAARTVKLLDLTDPVLVGQSMGCQVVAHAVADNPGLCAAYLLIGPTVDPSARGPVRLAGRLALDMTRESRANNLIVLRDYARMGPLRYLRTSRSMLADHIDETIAACTVPGLIVRGARDPIAPARWVRDLAGLAPDAGWAEVPGASHNVQHTHPVELAAACDSFLSRAART